MALPQVCVDVLETLGCLSGLKVRWGSPRAAQWQWDRALWAWGGTKCFWHRAGPGHELQRWLVKSCNFSKGWGPNLTQLSIKQLEYLRCFPGTSFKMCYNKPRFPFYATWGCLLPCSPALIVSSTLSKGVLLMECLHSSVQKWALKKKIRLLLKNTSLWKKSGQNWLLKIFYRQGNKAHPQSLSWSFLV